jgi:hypothetical protein
MSKKAVTSKRVATEASEILRARKITVKPKSVAGSALAQTPEKAEQSPSALGNRRVRRIRVYRKRSAE